MSKFATLNNKNMRLRRLFKRRQRLRVGDVIIDYDGITCLEYEIYRIDPVLGIAFGRGVWEGKDYEKIFGLEFIDHIILGMSDSAKGIDFVSLAEVM